MKKAIINILMLLLLVSSSQITVIATEKKNYSFDELIIEKAVTSPYLEEENKYSEGLAIKETKYNTGEYINIPGEGNVAIETIKYGFIDSNNNEIIPCIYDNVSGINSNMYMSSISFGDIEISKKPGFYEGVACVQKDGKWGAIDKSGNTVIPFKFKGLDAFSEGLAKVRNDNGKCGFIDKQGNVVVPMIYGDVGYFYNGYAMVESADTGKRGFVDKTGNLVVPMIYDNVSEFHEGYAVVFNSSDDYSYLGCMGFGYYGYVNTLGQQVVPMIYKDAGHFSSGLAPVAIPDERFSREKGQKLYGYIDSNGNMVIKPQYSEANPFYEGLANVTVNSRAIVGSFGDGSELVNFDEPEMSGYIDIYGNNVITLSKNYPSYSNGTENFVYGTAVVYKKDTDEYVRIKNPLAVSVIVNGNTIKFDQPPIIIDGRTLVPVRAVFESLGVNVEWFSDTQTVLAQKDGRTVTLKIDSNVMKIGNKEILLDVPAQIINNRTLVPVRAVAEAFECNVDWDGSTSTVIINNR